MRNTFIFLIAGVFVAGVAGYIFVSQRTDNVVSSPNTETELSDQHFDNQTSTSTASQSETQLYTLDEVASHGDTGSCWAVVNGAVYDLTPWINQHPGGPEAIAGLCGNDGSTAFNNQHGGQRRPEKEIANFLIGTLSQ